MDQDNAEPMKGLVRWIRPPTDQPSDENTGHAGCGADEKVFPAQPRYLDSESNVNVQRVAWASPTEFLLTCIGHSVGLGNVCRFPYLIYKNGEGAFLIPYIIMMVLVGLPLLIMNLIFGQYVSHSSKIASHVSEVGGCQLNLTDFGPWNEEKWKKHVLWLTDGVDDVGPTQMLITLWILISGFITLLFVIMGKNSVMATLGREENKHSTSEHIKNNQNQGISSINLASVGFGLMIGSGVIQKTAGIPDLIEKFNLPDLIEKFNLTPCVFAFGLLCLLCAVSACKLGIMVGPALGWLSNLLSPWASLVRVYSATSTVVIVLTALELYGMLDGTVWLIAASTLTLLNTGNLDRCIVQDISTVVKPVGFLVIAHHMIFNVLSVTTGYQLAEHEYFLHGISFIAAITVVTECMMCDGGKDEMFHDIQGIKRIKMAIDACQTALVSKIKLDDIFKAYLIKQGVLTCDELLNMQYKGRSEQIVGILNAVSRGMHAQYEGFLMALTETGQSQLVQLLERALQNSKGASTDGDVTRTLVSSIIDAHRPDLLMSICLTETFRSYLIQVNVTSSVQLQDLEHKSHTGQIAGILDCV